MSENVPEVLYFGEVQLMDFGESRTGGPWIKLRLPNPEDLAIFRGLDIGELKKTGHIFNLILTEEGQLVAEEEEAQKGGALSQSAALFCKDRSFQEFCNTEYGVQMDEEGARGAILMECGIKSRRELDHNEYAKDSFLEIRKKFLEWVEAVN
jgi:hypothetical protein